MGLFSEEDIALREINGTVRLINLRTGAVYMTDSPTTNSPTVKHIDDMETLNWTDIGCFALIAGTAIVFCFVLYMEIRDKCIDRARFSSRAQWESEKARKRKMKLLETLEYYKSLAESGRVPIVGIGREPFGKQDNCTELLAEDIVGSYDRCVGFPPPPPKKGALTPLLSPQQVDEGGP